jgi:predicted RNA binding protein YcfA (HicA-like mRNA interferase family)
MPYKYHEIERKLFRLGYDIRRYTKGSHVVFKKEKQTIVIPNHGNKDISIGIEKTIYKIINITPEEFRKI